MNYLAIDTSGKNLTVIIKKGDEIFATQRGDGDFQGGWEFPGGKVEVGENLVIIGAGSTPYYSFRKQGLLTT